MAVKKDLVGKRFGYLKVLESCGSKNNRAMWVCQCDCGIITKVNTHSLTSGNTKSCGCKKYGGHLSHGEAKAGQTRLYRIWSAMKGRCTNKNNAGFYLYGGKGVKVCEEWKRFEPFRDWAVSHGYTDELTIDRIDSNGDYTPENCRWTTYKVQGNNTSRNHYVAAFGETMTISQWSDKFGIPAKTIAARLNLLGWCAEEAVSTPVRGANHVG